MKHLRRLLCLLLALLTMAALAPTAAMATESGNSSNAPSFTITIKYVVGKKTLFTQDIDISDQDVSIRPDTYIVDKKTKKTYEFVNYSLSDKKVSSITVPAYDGTDAWEDKWEDTISLVYKSHKHKYQPGYTRLYHWNICKCGYTSNAVYHDDPTTLTEKVCSCGYVFGNNAQLTTLWFTDVRFDTPFKKDIYDYTASVVTGYKDVTSTTIRIGTFDAMATVTMPENLEIHEGANKFEITVLAEDKTTTQTYTVLVMKPIKLGSNYIYNDSTNVFTEFKAAIKKKTAYIEVPEDVAAKMAEMAAQEKTSVLFKTAFSKWSIQQLDLTVPASLLTTMAEKSTGDLKVETPYGTTLVIPNADLAALAKDQKTLVLRVGKDNSFAVLAGEESLALSDKVQLVLPETK